MSSDALEFFLLQPFSTKDHQVSSSLLLQPRLLGKMNERQVLTALQNHGPLSRAEVCRRLGLSAPTVSKAVASLLEAGLLEESAVAEVGRGRPAKQLRLASRSAQVLGIVVDANHCELIAAGLNGQLHEDRHIRCEIPENYESLLRLLTKHAQSLMSIPHLETLGLGVSTPGLVDYRQQRSVLSPNLPITNGHSLASDLTSSLGIPCVLLQESHALCLAEQQYGAARGLADFGMLDIGTGIGLGIVSGDRLVTGHRGMAGEIGHITVQMEGRRCGCGNFGCLETEAGDAALVYRVSQHIGRAVTIDEIIQQAHDASWNVGPALDLTLRYLAIGVAAVINLFNPTQLFLHGRLFEIDPQSFDRLLGLVTQRALPPSRRDCVIVRARGCKRQGAVAGIIQHLTSAIAPLLEAPALYDSKTQAAIAPLPSIE